MKLLVEHENYDTRWSGTFVQKCEYDDLGICYCLYTTRDDELWFDHFPTDEEIKQSLIDWNYI